jgi:hypothetical protein
MPIIEVTLSEQSMQILDELATCGIYGIDRDEVAARFIDTMVGQFVEHPRYNGAEWIRKLKEAKDREREEAATP